MSTTTTVYLLCFAPGIPRGGRKGNACHYLGSTSLDVFKRLEAHRRGRGSPLVKAAFDAGLDVHVVGLWPGSKREERKTKNGHNLARLCPRCGDRHARRERVRRHEWRV